MVGGVSGGAPPDPSNQYETASPVVRFLTKIGFLLLRDFSRRFVLDLDDVNDGFSTGICTWYWNAALDML